MDTIMVSVGVFAHNDGETLGHLLEQVSVYQSDEIKLDEIFVVSSGSRDQTNEIAQRICAKDGRFRLVSQDSRHGKTAAINTFLQYARHEVCVLLNADTLLGSGALTNLISTFTDRTVAMAGGRPTPVTKGKGIISFAVALLWDLHHRIALRKPKMGELVAFRKIVGNLPVPDAAADEEWLHSVMLKRGFRVVYVPEAVVYNRGPRSLSEFVSQRRRIHSQHLSLIRLQEFQPATCSWLNLVVAGWDYLAEHPHHLPSTTFVAFLETACRALGTWDFFLRRKSVSIWPMIESSKGLTPLDLPIYNKSD